ncbi:MAG: hypothetical protein CFE45_07550 [Burkholderiales bacterium PBB5]|nr:MAG: hypothetical protein CFE45_07550 [Burkholderiales bacterium PBB5]
MSFPFFRTALFTLALAAAPLASQASFLVQQWQGGSAGNAGLAGADAVIASGTAPSASARWNTIDFSDTADGTYNGYVAGHSAWPLATLLGQSGENATANTNFAARITGSFLITNAGNYTFTTYGDDGLRLKIDGTTVINDNSYHPASTNAASQFLSAGLHTVDLVFFEGGGQGLLEFSMASASGGPRTLVYSGSDTATVPEPGSLALVGLACLGLWAAGRRRT